MASRRDPVTTARAYAREIERVLERLAGRPVVFSHRDWDLARRWHDDGVPLGMVLELLEDKGRRATRGLGSIAKAVEAAWTVVRAGQIRADATPVEPTVTDDDDGDPYGVAADHVADPTLERLLRAASIRRRAGEYRGAIDADDDHDLAAASPAEWVAAAERAVEARLAAYRGRRPPVEFGRARDRARVDALRARARLPPTVANRVG